MLGFIRLGLNNRKSRPSHMPEAVVGVVVNNVAGVEVEAMARVMEITIRVKEEEEEVRLYRVMVKVEVKVKDSLIPVTRVPAILMGPRSSPVSSTGFTENQLIIVLSLAPAHGVISTSRGPTLNEIQTSPAARILSRFTVYCIKKTTI